MIAVTIGVTVGLFMSQAIVYVFGSKKNTAVMSFLIDVSLVCLCAEYRVRMHFLFVLIKSSENQPSGSDQLTAVIFK